MTISRPRHKRMLQYNVKVNANVKGTLLMLLPMLMMLPMPMMVTMLHVPVAA